MPKEKQNTCFKVEKLSYEADGKTILQDLDFQIFSGERVNLRGASGSGKSTLLQLLALLLKPSSGHIEYQGKDLESWPYTTYRQAVSYCHQTPRLFGESIFDNLAFPSLIRQKKFDADRARALLADVRLEQFDLRQGIDRLSGGERQRLALIRHLMFPPEVLLLDEITTGLDAKTAAIIWTWLFKVAEEENLTLIWVSHDETEQRRADRFLTIQNGHMEVATHA